MNLDNDLYIIEYNAKQNALHLELLSSRLRKNIDEFTLHGKQQSPGWVTVGVMIGNKAAAEFCEAFRTLINKTRMNGEKTK